MQNTIDDAKFDEIMKGATPAQGVTPTAPQSAYDRYKASRAVINPAPKPAPAPKPTLAQNISSSIKDRGEAVYGNITGTSPESQGENSVTRGIQATGNAFGGVTDVATNVVGSVIPQGVKDAFSKSKSINSVKKGYSQIMDNVGMGLDDLIKRFPEVGSAVESALKQSGAFGEISGTILGAEGLATGVKSVFNKSKNLIDTVPTKIKANATVSAEGRATMQAGDELTKINEMITPKPTVKQAKLAQEQGRLYKGSEGRLFKEGTLDRVAANDQQVRSSNTVKKYVPDASKLDEATLTTEIKSSVQDIGRKLKPELQKVSIDEPIMTKINDSWKKVKSVQSEDAFSVLEPRMINRIQKDFEARIGKLKEGTLDDIWQARQAYDDSVGLNVRQATDLSSDVVQAQKDIWLENRKVFSDALTSAENGLGDVAKKSFRDMTDLYEAKNGLLSKAKIEKVAKPSKASKFFDSKTGKVVKTGAQIIGGGALLKGGMDLLP